MDQEQEAKVAEVKADIEKKFNLTKIEELLTTNTFEFEHESTTYRLRKPTFKERQDLYRKRIEKYTELLSNEKNLLEDDLKKLYKSRGIDIDEMSATQVRLEQQKKDLYIKLGEALSQKAAEEETSKYKDEIESLARQQYDLSIKKQMLLEYSIENQLNLSIYYYVIYLVTEKKEEEKWIKAFASYDEMETLQDSKLFSELALRAPLLFRHELELSQ